MLFSFINIAAPDNVLIFLQIMCYAHIAAAILGMVGALRVST